MTKLMTVLVAYGMIPDLDATFRMTQEIIDPLYLEGLSLAGFSGGEDVVIRDLLYGSALPSGAEASYALAIAACGSEEAFVEKMNKRAADLGMTNTSFENTNGLDDTTENHVTSAKDIAIMSRELLKHEKVLEYTTIWMDTIRNGTFGLTNTNRLIRYYKGATGLKTGSTSKAGFCISATAERNGLHLIAVIMGSPTRDDRNQSACELLDYGFANYAFYENMPKECELKVIGSITKVIPVTCQDSYKKLISKAKIDKITCQIEMPETLTAPIYKGQTVGRAVYYMDGEAIGEIPIIAKESVERINFIELFKIALKKLSIF
jgi:D-alanyl-D-alanine carboxypeptidase (penicillin-binding protein 5/6)